MRSASRPSASVPVAHFRSVSHDSATIDAFLARYANASHVGCNKTAAAGEALTSPLLPR